MSAWSPTKQRKYSTIALIKETCLPHIVSIATVFTNFHFVMNGDIGLGHLFGTDIDGSRFDISWALHVSEYQYDSPVHMERNATKECHISGRRRPARCDQATFMSALRNIPYSPISVVCFGLILIEELHFSAPSYNIWQYGRPDLAYFISVWEKRWI